MITISPVRSSPLAGTWYEADPQSLARTVDNYLEQAELPNLPGEVIAVVAPHAGLLYSGAVAGYSFATLRGTTPERVAIISPMHHLYNQPLLTSAHSAYQTPLGDVPVDAESVARLDACLYDKLGFGLTPIANDPEHAVEIELPFLQRVVKSDFQLLPVMMRSQTPQVARAMGAALAETLHNKNALLVASTDLSHFYTQQIARQLDTAILAQVEAFSPEGVFEVEQSGRGEACGIGALAAVLWAAHALGANTVKLLRHATSGDVTGDFRRVVGYGAAVILKTK